ncbi:hypothetical protein HOLleu_07028 [Holothuria leucospilota]|uniref:Uncharacterized protein n=1 Tax=Holothuria leucospilota TaxID=206669 RepID=A0A9Q1HGN4_HOLLE|nr:hypothetical protein HOLleu_07028 [Holothuria leucospilota]
MTTLVARAKASKETKETCELIASVIKELLVNKEFTDLVKACVDTVFNKTERKLESIAEKIEENADNILGLENKFSALEKEINTL